MSPGAPKRATIAAMGAFGQWLLHEDRKDLFEITVALVLDLLFLGLAALLLWPLGRAGLALSLAKGLGLLWVVLGLTGGLLHRVHEFFKVNLYDHSDAFVLSNLAVSCSLQIGWAAFAAPTVQLFLPNAPLWMIVVLYGVGALSCLAANYAVSSFFQGAIYRLTSLPLALVCFAVFSIWPAAAQVLFGWFFRLFEAGGPVGS
jgi:hypothetical protein